MYSYMFYKNSKRASFVGLLLGSSSARVSPTCTAGRIALPHIVCTRIAKVQMADGRPNMAQLIRAGAAEATQRRASASNGSAVERRPSKLDRMVQSLSWRDAYARAETYPLDVGGISFGIRQLMMGELTGLGTGATVWPAAVVLIKFLERRFGHGGLAGKRVVELGAGTAAVGLGAAALGATVVLTDMHSIIDLTRQNAADFASAVQATTHPHVRVGSSDVKGSMNAAAGDVFVELFDWSDQARVEHLQRRAGGAFDYVLVSECVLPKLYPIELPAANTASPPTATTERAQRPGGAPAVGKAAAAARQARGAQ